MTTAAAFQLLTAALGFAAIGLGLLACRFGDSRVGLLLALVGLAVLVHTAVERLSA